jgi:hypothetical protein
MTPATGQSPRADPANEHQPRSGQSNSFSDIDQLARISRRIAGLFQQDIREAVVIHRTLTLTPSGFLKVGKRQGYFICDEALPAYQRCARSYLGTCCTRMFAVRMQRDQARACAG